LYDARSVNKLAKERKGRKLGLRNGVVAETTHQVIVDQAGGLHQGVDDGGADKAEAAFLQVLAPCRGLWGYGRHLAVGLPLVADRRAANKLPGVGVEGAKFVLHFQKGLRVGNGRGDFQAVTDDPGIGQKLPHSFGIEQRDFSGVKPAENFTVTLALFQDGIPAEACLRAFESQEFEPEAFVVNGNAPLFVVVGDVQRIGCPVATNGLFDGTLHFASHEIEWSSWTVSEGGRSVTCLAT